MKKAVKIAMLPLLAAGALTLTACGDSEETTKIEETTVQDGAGSAVQDGADAATNDTAEINDTDTSDKKEKKDKKDKDTDKVKVEETTKKAN